MARQMEAVHKDRSSKEPGSDGRVSRQKAASLGKLLSQGRPATVRSKRLKKTN